MSGAITNRRERIFRANGASTLAGSAIELAGMPRGEAEAVLDNGRCISCTEILSDLNSNARVLVNASIAPLEAVYPASPGKQGRCKV